MYTVCLLLYKIDVSFHRTEELHYSKHVTKDMLMLL